ncbi:MAG: DUF2093 domain-containing protein [Pseudomonadota bacterium]
MMNKLDLGGGGEAKLRYLDADFEVQRSGDFVRCAVTGEVIPLRDLRYWSVGLQQAYVNAAAANKARDEAKANGETF